MQQNFKLAAVNVSSPTVSVVLLVIKGVDEYPFTAMVWDYTQFILSVIPENFFMLLHLLFSSLVMHRNMSREIQPIGLLLFFKN